MKFEESYQNTSYTAWTESDFQQAWLEAAVLSRSELVEQGRGKAVYRFEDRYAYDVWCWSKAFGRDLKKSPAFEAFHILVDLTQMGVPVCRPLAVVVERNRLTTQARLLTYELAEAETCSEVLCKREIPENIWQQLGALTRQLHDLKVSLKDLSLDAFVLNSQAKLFLRKVYGLSKNQTVDSAWKQIELQSLLTSILEMRQREPHFFFDDRDWLALTQAYMTRARPEAGN